MLTGDFLGSTVGAEWAQSPKWPSGWKSTQLFIFPLSAVHSAFTYTLGTKWVSARKRTYYLVPLVRLNVKSTHFSLRFKLALCLRNEARIAHNNVEAELMGALSRGAERLRAFLNLFQANLNSPKIEVLSHGGTLGPLDPFCYEKEKPRPRLIFSLILLFN